MKFIVLPLFIFQLFYSGSVPPALPYLTIKPGEQRGDGREKAFGILRDKCNACHAKKRRAEIFTKENVDRLAPEIKEQVFVKKKMPKGKKIKLTENEMQLLERWVESVL